MSYPDPEIAEDDGAADDRYFPPPARDTEEIRPMPLPESNLPFFPPAEFGGHLWKDDRGPDSRCARCGLYYAHWSGDDCLGPVAPAFDAADPAQGAPKATPNPVPGEAIDAAHAAAIATWHVMATTGHREAVEAAVRAAAPILLAAGRTAAADAIRKHLAERERVMQALPPLTLRARRRHGDVDAAYRRAARLAEGADRG